MDLSSFYVLIVKYLKRAFNKGEGYYKVREKKENKQEQEISHRQEGTGIFKYHRIPPASEEVE